jgi:glutaredoxin 3
MFCNRTKEFLSQHGIAFEERDVTSDERAIEELRRRSLMTTPVTLVDDQVVVGFDTATLARLLDIDQHVAEKG